MIRYVMVDPDGNVRSVVMVSSSEDDSLALNTPEGCSAIACEDPAVLPGASRFDAATGSFSAIPPQPTAPEVTFTFNEWVDRFPLADQAGIMAATLKDPMAKLIYDRAMVAGISGAIDPKDPRTIEGVQYLISQGYITAEAGQGALAV